MLLFSEIIIKINYLIVGQTLLQQQMEKEDMSCLPTLHLAEIDKKIKEEPTSSVQAGMILYNLIRCDITRCNCTDG